METMTVNGFDFALWLQFGRRHVECRGIVADFDTQEQAMAWVYTLAHP